MPYSAFMDRNKPPDFTPGYPSKGERISLAWATAWARLVDADNGWVSGKWLASAMAEAAGVQDKTARNLLDAARRAGHLQRRTAATGSSTRKYTQYRIPYRVAGLVAPEPERDR